MIRQMLALAAAGLLLGGCYTAPQRGSGSTVAPAPGREAAPVPREGRVEESGGIRIQPYQLPESGLTTPVHGKAVTALLETANRQEAAGDHAAAVGTIERALRIEPRNAHLWNRLAHLRFAQGQTGLAGDLAAKSSALAGADVALKRDNWLLIARVRRAAGDVAGARVAERKARMLY
jgi:Tfp pilus assembly protein PilF